MYIDALDNMFDVGDLVNTILESAIQTGNQIVPLENLFKSNDSFDTMIALETFVENLISEYSTGTNSFNNFVNVLQMLGKDDSNATNNGIFIKTVDFKLVYHYIRFFLFSFIAIPNPIIYQTESAFTKLATVLQTTIAQIKTLVNNLKQLMIDVVVTPNGFIEIPQAIQGQFIANVAELTELANTAKNDFNSISVDINAIKNSVNEANPNNGI